MDATLTFVARRVAGGWLLHSDALPEVEVTSTRLTDAHARVREEVAKATGADLDDVDVVVNPELTGRAVGHLEAASALQEQLQQLADRAREALALGVQFLLEDGLTQREVALALGLSVARVRQLAAVPTERPVPLTARHMQHLYDSGALRPPQ
ncbi:putative RNA polymerase, sigma 28 subunit, FliA/WhiG subfamily (plasmid) [Xylanimonas cellulosilytica DSM 15894]|uniref:RNA polymerase, sigma 28 subunit, FliA/WhiG subfamily n=1 Tax=Xylanimonas cellulosilytica (strain DSM 15894 / JCM 12276 / CECT 5975 / KCTC 9989 / LMG 20990 / NBRC 107835 / XIL07) TaxID=446471 RepID=D1C106_XYLCX|nr:putative RNA polymerase, sigma 28 subunit, FliA/WhiG subfamily [Xylanimonas cellulosilytica DSM 15894]